MLSSGRERKMLLSPESSSQCIPGLWDLVLIIALLIFKAELRILFVRFCTIGLKKDTHLPGIRVPEALAKRYEEALEYFGAQHADKIYPAC
jgi:hypothetical protein